MGKAGSMRLVSVNVGQERTQMKGAELETTGIYKMRTSEPVRVTRLGLAQDFIGDPKHHGGPDQAVYVYGATDYERWARELGGRLDPGTFGENLTVSDLESAEVHIGDRLQVGTAVLEVTSPRIPCSTLAARMGDPNFIKRYRLAERPGLYCRVIEEGVVRTGDAVVLSPYEGETISALQMFRDHYRRDKDEAALRRILRAPISVRSRAALEDQLRKLLAGVA